MDRLRILAETRGYFTRSDALADGLDDKAIRRALKARLWTRIRQGVYTCADLWAAADERRRHLAAADAVARRLGGRVALSHTSAALVHGLAIDDVDLSLVHVTRLDGAAGRTEAGVVHHEGFCLDGDLLEVDGVPVVRPVRAALEVAMVCPTEWAVVTMDSALRSGCSREDLESTFDVMRFWPGARRLQVAVRLADGRADSVGESRARYLCFRHDLPSPELQFEVRDHRGELVGTTDFAWPEHRLLGEFDGKIKYGRLLREGEEPGDAVFREKCREDVLREVTQWSMVRLTWADLYRGAATAARIRRLLRWAA